MKILLTGATGYLGSHLTRHLIKCNHKVVILKRKTSSMKRLVDIENNLICYDIENLDLTIPFKQQGSFDVIIHTSTCYGKKSEKKKEIFETNTLFPIRLLKASILFNTKIFINTDTYYNINKNISYNLRDYAQSKKNFIDKARLFSLKKKIKIINLRLEHVYGPKDSELKFVNWLVNSLSKENKKIYLTKGEQKRDLIFIDDVVKAYDTILKHIKKIKEYYTDIGVGCGETISIRKFAELAHTLTKSKSKLIFGVIPYQKNEIMFSQANNKILKDFEWNCTVNIKQGLKRVIKLV